MPDAHDRRPVNLNGVAEIVTDDLDQLLAVLPPHICDPLQELQDRKELLEVVMDLGREPEARLPGREVLLSAHTPRGASFWRRRRVAAARTWRVGLHSSASRQASCMSCRQGPRLSAPIYSRRDRA